MDRPLFEQDPSVDCVAIRRVPLLRVQRAPLVCAAHLHDGDKGISIELLDRTPIGGADRHGAPDHRLEDRVQVERRPANDL